MKVIFYNVLRRLFLLIISLNFFLLHVKAQSLAKSNLAKSEWVYLNNQDKLTYKTLPKGDRIMDFSHAGYMGGGVAFSSPEVKIILDPITGDNSEFIQNAIDKVSEMKLVNGLRGTVLLKPRVYNCEKAIIINASGVVLRGSGSDNKGTTISMTGKGHTCVVVKGAVSSKVIGKPSFFSDAYVPSGTYSFNLSDVSGLNINDTIRIIRPVTNAWVNFMGMDTLVRDGRKQTWITGEITTDRVIKNIVDKTITVDVPLTDSYDSKYLNPPGTAVVKVTSSGELSTDRN